jgi:hypothetical protein
LRLAVHGNISKDERLRRDGDDPGPDERCYSGGRLLFA